MSKATKVGTSSTVRSVVLDVDFDDGSWTRLEISACSTSGSIETINRALQKAEKALTDLFNTPDDVT